MPSHTHTHICPFFPFPSTRQEAKGKPGTQRWGVNLWSLQNKVTVAGTHQACAPEKLKPPQVSKLPVLNGENSSLLSTKTSHQYHTFHCPKTVVHVALCDNKDLKVLEVKCLNPASGEHHTYPRPKRRALVRVSKGAI